jgi:septal ring factor EnvC (AmiA/AmiB activator)
MKKRFLFSVLLALIVAAASAQQPQTKAELEKQRESIQKEIDDVRRSLNATTKNKKETLGQLTLVLKKLRLRQAQIRNINQQIELINNDIYQSNRDIAKLKKELDTLKLQYEKSVVYAYKNRSNYDFLNFLFSSTSFNDALKRVAYLKSYRNYREQQAETIYNTQALLEEKIAGLSENKKKKSFALQEENKQRGVLEDEKQEKNQVIASLKTREKELNNELAAKRKQDLKLKAAITAAINREVAEARRKAELARKEKEAAEKRAGGTTGARSSESATAKASETKETARPIANASIFDDDPASRKLSEDFEKNRGSLPWPIESGRVSMRFGLNTVEGLKINYNNPGITIETEVNKAVKSVFDGDVTAVFNVGPVQGVIIKHGKYFSTYSNLTNVVVSRDQKVKTGQMIGHAADKGDGTADVEFLISNENQNFDPEKWLR